MPRPLWKISRKRKPPSLKAKDRRTAGQRICDREQRIERARLLELQAAEMRDTAPVNRSHD